MSRDFKRVVVLCVAGAVSYWLGYNPPKKPTAAGPAMQAYLDAPDMGIRCFDDSGHPVTWQWVSPDNAWRWCGITPQRLNELRSTDWQAVAAANRKGSFLTAAVFAGAVYLLLGVWLLKTLVHQSRSVREMRRLKLSAHGVLRRYRADKLWVFAWVLALPAIFLLPAALREGIITVAGPVAAVALGVVALGWPFYALYRWLQERREAQEEKVASAMRRDTRPKLATAETVSGAAQQKELGLKTKKLRDL